MSNTIVIRHDNAELTKRVSRAMAANPYLTNRKRLNVSAEAGSVTLQGTVVSFFQKQMAQEMLRHLDGITEIHNQLEVDWN